MTRGQDIFTEAFTQSLPDEPLVALHRICEVFFEISGPRNRPTQEDCYRAFAYLKNYAENHGVKLELPRITGTANIDISEITRAFKAIYKDVSQPVGQRRFESFDAEYARHFSNTFLYEFTEGDVKRIQTLINELRDEIAKVKDLTDEHKQRIMKRLEKMQSELHKKMSSLDMFWGGLIDGSLAFKQIGENFKPVLDRLTELGKIGWNAASRAHGLPSNTPLELGESEEEKDDE